ncbi:MAG: hypothetical protein LQ350_006452 [Teloschistes chrysophthalmus]|nr:MAG: hypothetical protein LQ350_006452 [Niorma chrysophthalma]
MGKDFQMLELTSSTPPDNSPVYFKPNTLIKLIYGSDETTEKEIAEKEKEVNLNGYEALTVTLDLLVEARTEHIDCHLDPENLKLVEQNILQSLRCLQRFFERRHDCGSSDLSSQYLNTLARLVAKLGCHHESKNSEVKCTFRPLHQMIKRTRTRILK